MFLLGVQSRFGTSTGGPPQLKNPDFIVAGGGIAGVCAARSLVARGLRCVVIDRGAIGREATWAAAGILAPQAETDPSSPLMALGLAARNRHKSLAEELALHTGLTIEPHRYGVLRLFFDEAEGAEVERLVKNQTAAGLKAELVSHKGLLRLEPAANPAAIGAALFPDDHRVDNRLLMDALRLSAKHLGVVFEEFTSVLGIETRGDRFVAVKTTTGRIEAKGFINAMGAWASQLTGDPTPPPVVPVKGHLVALTAGPPMRHVVYGDHGYLVPRLDGRLIAGTTMEDAGFDARVHARGVATVIEKAIRIAPDCAGCSVGETWAGLRPGTSDGLPVLGASPSVAGVHLVTGLFRNGILLGPLAAEVVVAQALGEPPSLKLDAFRPGRFVS